MNTPSSSARSVNSILIVDDEVNVAAELADAAEDEGYIVHQANSAAAALVILANHPEIGVMVSDIRMPDCDGLELTRRALEGRDESAALEVILITGHATLDDAVLAVRTGAFDFVRKPFRLQQIFEAVSRGVARAIGRRRIAVALEGMEKNRAKPVTGLAGGDFEGHSELLLGLMHELRTPLVPILGYAEILESQHCSPDDTVEYAKLISGGGRQLLSTVDDLVLLAQIESGQVRAAPRSISAGALLQALAQAHLPAAALMGKSIEVAPIEAFDLSADVPLLQRALGVLVQIALQRSPRTTAVTLAAFHHHGSVKIMVGTFGAAADPRDVSSTSYAEDVARQLAPLGIRFARAVLALHGGEIVLRGAEQMAFSALAILPDAVR